MRSIAIALLDKRREVLILTRVAKRQLFERVTVAPIAGTIRGLTRCRSDLAMGSTRTAS